MMRVLLVPDLPLERWPAMDKYAHRLHDWLESSSPGFEVRLAAYIGDLTREARDGRRSGGHPRWWAREVDPARIVLPGPLVEPQRYAARYVLYPWRLKRESRRADLVHILDHSYAHLRGSVRRRPVSALRAVADAFLLQVGGGLAAEQESVVERIGLRPYVRSVTSADEATLRRAYRAADVLLFPSLYEGFGSPVLEAFASGLPVVTSGAGGLREVGGDATLVVEGRDPGGYMQALEGLSDDPDRQEALVERGRARARSYTWQKTAERTAAVYRELL